MGRDIFAVPGSIFSPVSEGPNKLIRDGAKPVCNVIDILEEYIGVCPQNIISRMSGLDDGANQSQLTFDTLETNDGNQTQKSSQPKRIIKNHQSKNQLSAKTEQEIQEPQSANLLANLPNATTEEKITTNRSSNLPDAMDNEKH